MPVPTTIAGSAASAGRESPAAEWFRRGALLAAALALTFPFLTTRPIGGTDARWYLYMLKDALDQMRAGHVPALVGQGPFAWNGGIHPFRSAPIYLWLAELWNAVTGGVLNPFLIQHLTVVTSAVAGTLGFYFAAAALVPARRWEAFLAALVYLEVPAWLGLVVWSDAYMSYMAFAALPWLMYGNARCLIPAQRRGYAVLAAGLALVWMCHPPIAALCTLITLLIQGGFMMTEASFPWARAAGGAVWFAGLGAYYFVSMSELPPRPGGDTAVRALIQVAGLLLALVGVGAWGVKRRGRVWAGMAAAGLLFLIAASWPWFVWAVATIVLTLVGAKLGRKLGWFDAADHAFGWVWVCGLAGTVVASALLGVHRPEASADALRGLDVNSAHFREYWTPETWPQMREGNFQLGWTLGLGLLAMGVTFFGSRPLVAKLFFAGSASLLLCFFRVPGISDFLVAYFPHYFSHLIGFPLGLRLLPVIAAFAVMAGFLWISLDRPGPPLGRGWLLAGLLVAVGWGGFQASFLMRWTYHQMSDSAHTSLNLRPENAVLDRYAYDLLPLPAYFSNGKMDPSIESRLRDSAGRLRFGPDEAARETEARGIERIRLTAHVLPDHPGWLVIDPLVTIAAGAHDLIRFEFNPGKNYAGFLIMVSQHGYRDYHLPDSGMGNDSAFGIGPGHGQVLSLWNTGDGPEQYRFTFAKEPANTFIRDGEWFGDLVISKFDPAVMSVRLDAFIPYRATVSASVAGTLETFRAFLPGYRATVDGRPVPVERSAEAQVQVAVPAGTHTVELNYVGTRRLHLAAAVSLLSWAALGWFGLRSGGRRTRRSGWGLAAAVGLAAAFLAEFWWFDRQTSLHQTWVYPRWNDQIQYLTEAYTGYQFSVVHGFWAGLRQTLFKPSAQGVLYDTFALVAFRLAGVSRSAALALNLLAWLGLQAAFYAVTVRHWRSRALGWAAVGLLLGWATPLAAGPGSAVDFRLDFMAACAFGVALAATIRTNGFRLTGPSLLAGAAIGLALLLRFLTGTYFVVIGTGLLVWVLVGPGRRLRCLNLFLAAGVAGAMALPEFWRNREWVWNYYVIGHFTGPESAIRNPHWGILRSLEFIGSSLIHDHLGAVMGGCVLGGTLVLGAFAGFPASRHETPSDPPEDRSAPSAWWVPAALFTGSPLLVLTLHSQKSPIVLSLLVPGMLMLVLGGWAGLARRVALRRGGRVATRVRAATGAAVLLLGAGHFEVAQADNPHSPEFIRDARRVNQLADYIFASSRRAGLAAPRVAVDQVTDCLDGQVLRVICYERHRVWVPFVMTLPTGIMREREELLMDRLAESDYALIAVGDPSEGGFPYDREMRALRPKTEAWCRAHLRLVERLPLFGYTWALYAKPGLP
jgi:hypothetical protein